MPFGRARWINVGEWPLSARGQGTIWRVRDANDSSAPMRALKEMRYAKKPGTTAFDRFEQEIRTTSLLSREHEGIVEVLDFGLPTIDEEWKPFYVMPLAEGTLARAKDLRGQLEHVLTIGTEIADALLVAHKHGVVHRDVKPDNVLLLGDERRPVLADFGICFHSSIADARLTGTNAQTVGSADFVAPELLGGGASESITPRADIYSLGKTLYAVVAGTAPFPREDHRSTRWNLAERLRDDRLLHLHGLLDRMVVEDPDRRFSDMSECKDALHRALNNIRHGVGYREGLYLGRVAAEDLTMRFARDLIGPTMKLREDVILDAISESSEAIDRLRAAANNQSEASGETEGATKEATELLCAVGLPLVQRNEVEGFRQWLVPIRRWLTAGTDSDLGLRRLWRTAGVLSCYAAGALAWSRRRFKMLKHIIALYADYPPGWIHLDVVDGSASRLLDWYISELSASPVRLRAAPELKPNEALPLVFGLACLLSLSKLSADEFSLAYDRKHAQKYLVAHPALYYSALHWTESLAETMVLDSAFEAQLAREVFDWSPPELRSFGARVTPLLQRQAAILAAELNLERSWVGRLGGGPRWQEWTAGRSAEIS